MTRYEKNASLNGIELYFDSIPEESIRQEIKKLGFRWNVANKFWHAKETEDENPDDNQIVFRYADAYLMTAEALAELGRYSEALPFINVIRERAGAEPFVSSNSSLKTNILKNMK